MVKYKWSLKFDDFPDSIMLYVDKHINKRRYNDPY